MQTDIKTNTIARPAIYQQRRPAHWYNRDNGIMGAMLAVAVLSIAYSSYIVWFSTDGLTTKLLIAPQMVLGAIIFGRKFIK